MKRLFLSVLAIVAITTSSVFANAYDHDDIGQLVDAKNLRADFGSIGVLFGSDSILGAVSLNSDGLSDYLVFNPTNTDGDAQDNTFNGSVYAGVGYKAPAFGAWLGYEFGYERGVDGETDPVTGVFTPNNIGWAWHAPHLQFTAMDNNFRINIPIVIGMVVPNKEAGDTKLDAEGVIALSTEIQARYYTQIDYFTAIRLYVYYGQIDYSGAESTTIEDGEKMSSFGVRARFYFDIPTDGPVSIGPQFRLGYVTALGDYGSDTSIKAQDGYVASTTVKRADDAAVSTFETSIRLALSAANDIVSVYTAPYIEYSLTSLEDAASVKNAISIGNYMEIELYPVENLTIYLELDTSYHPTIDDPNDALANTGVSLSPGAFGFATGSGVRWYF